MKNPHDKAARRQRGVALLMTLSILALLLIMAMSFAYTSKTNRLSAGISADLVQSRLMCDTGLSRVLASMKYSYDPLNPTPGTPAQRAYPPTWLATDTPSNQFPFAFQYGTTGQRYVLSADSASINSDGLPDDLRVPGMPAVITAAICSSSCVSRRSPAALGKSQRWTDSGSSGVRRFL